jgi:ferritin-like metal-binding protein YciE
MSFNKKNNFMRTLTNLFIDSLADIYYAENQLVRALPKMAKAAQGAELREAFESHLEETVGHVKKVERVFADFEQRARSKRCPAIAGLLEEGEEMAAENKSSPTVDAALIAAAQKVEHYEIATYGSLKEWAGLLGQQEAAELLEEILEEEKAADTTLSTLARARCNAAANKQSGNGNGHEAEEPVAHSSRRRSNVPRRVSRARGA